MFIQGNLTRVTPKLTDRNYSFGHMNRIRRGSMTVKTNIFYQKYIKMPLDVRFKWPTVPTPPDYGEVDPLNPVVISLNLVQVDPRLVD
jgi:hypothetical protein